MHSVTNIRTDRQTDRCTASQTYGQTDRQTDDIILSIACHRITVTQTYSTELLWGHFLFTFAVGYIV